MVIEKEKILRRNAKEREKRNRKTERWEQRRQKRRRRIQRERDIGSKKYFLDG